VLGSLIVSNLEDSAPPLLACLDALLLLLVLLLVLLLLLAPCPP
jgi:hypothetical protein